jgi:hypothetical protein
VTTHPDFPQNNKNTESPEVVSVKIDSDGQTVLALESEPLIPFELLSAGAKALYGKILLLSRKLGHAHICVSKLAGYIERSIRSASYYIAELKSGGYIETQRGWKNRYLLICPLVILSDTPRPRRTPSPKTPFLRPRIAEPVAEPKPENCRAYTSTTFYERYDDVTSTRAKKDSQGGSKSEIVVAQDLEKESRKEADIKIKSLCEKTGADEKAVKKILSLPEETKKAVLAEFERQRARISNASAWLMMACREGFVSKAKMEGVGYGYAVQHAPEPSKRVIVVAPPPPTRPELVGLTPKQKLAAMMASAKAAKA